MLKNCFHHNFLYKALQDLGPRLRSTANMPRSVPGDWTQHFKALEQQAGERVNCFGLGKLKN
jgi:hypothetical protein